MVLRKPIFKNREKPVAESQKDTNQRRSPDIATFMMQGYWNNGPLNAIYRYTTGTRTQLGIVRLCETLALNRSNDQEVR